MSAVIAQRNCLESAENHLRQEIRRKGIERHTSSVAFRMWCKTLMAIPKIKISKGTKIRNRYNHVPHLTQDTKHLCVNTVETWLDVTWAAGLRGSTVGSQLLVYMATTKL